jgi:hypothetical protein
VAGPLPSESFGFLDGRIRTAQEESSRPRLWVKKPTAIVPPLHREWWEVLPSVYKQNPIVVVVMAPTSWTTSIRQTRDEKHHFGVLMSPGGTLRGLQVIKEELATYMEHKEIFDEYKIEMADPAYIGRLGEIPQHLLDEVDRAPLAFCRDAMWKNYLDLKRCWTPQKLKA